MTHHKIFAIGGLGWMSYTTGFLFGQIASMVGSLQKKEEGLDLNEDQISMLSSIFSFMLLIGFGLAALATDKLGRRWPFILFSIPTMINWIVLYYATEMYQFMISRVIAGISVGAFVALNIFVTAEYTSPKTRAFFLNMITTAAPALGTTFGHAFGIVLHWRTVVLIALFFNALGITLPYFWIESPHWLASKGKFEECETAFWKLHGKTKNSERELQLLIKLEKDKLTRTSDIECKPHMKRLLSAMQKKYFWGLIILSVAINGYLVAAGKAIFSIFAPVLLEEITGTPDVLLFTLLVDGFFLLGSFMSCFLIRRTSMRTLLFSTGFTAIIVLVLCSIGYYFKNGENYFNWINVTFLAIYFVMLNAGPYPVLEAIFSEMYPLHFKMYAFFISGFTLISFFSLSIVLLPHTIRALGYHGLFLVYAAVMSICLFYIWLKLPETKGRTLQEIEMYYKTKNFNVDEILKQEESAVLV